MLLKPSFDVPLHCGRRLLPVVLDETAVNEPNRTFISVPKDLDVSKGFSDISYGLFAKAVNKFAHWLRAQFDPGQSSQVILYFGPTDLRYLLALLGCAKAGHIAFFSSHRNSIEAHKSIAERAGCEAVLVPKDAPVMLDQLLTVKPMVQIPTPDVDYFFQDLDGVENIPFSLAWEDAKDRPFCVLHTSGSTGIPNPVFVTYGTFACNDAHQLIPSLGGKPTLVNLLKGKRYFVALPLFHAASLTFTIGYNIFAGVIPVIPPPGPLTASIVNQIFTHGNLYGALLAPSLVVDCHNNNEYCVNMVQQLKLLTYVGGSLPEAVGNALTTRTKLMTLMGSCETALHPLEINEDPADWQYLTISKYLGHSFQEHRDGYYELIVTRNPRYEAFQGVFSTFPQKQEFASGDLFEQHPNRPESWVFRARTDDIIAFTTAEKLNPITMESVISANPNVKSALIGGQGKFQASLLIEPYVYPRSKSEEEEYIRNIWPSVLQANRECPAHGRIMKGFVMIANPIKPIPRAGKGTVQRHAALKLYADEFENLYTAMQHDKPNGYDEEQPDIVVTASDPESLDVRIEAVLRRILPDALAAAIQEVLPVIFTKIGDSLLSFQPSVQASVQAPDIINSGNHSTHALKVNDISSQLAIDPSKEIRRLIYDELSENLDIASLKDQDDLFKHGLDSLQMSSLVTTLNAFLIKAKPGIPLLNAKQIYKNPTIEQIASMVGE